MSSLKHSCSFLRIQCLLKRSEVLTRGMMSPVSILMSYMKAERSFWGSDVPPEVCNFFRICDVSSDILMFPRQFWCPPLRCDVFLRDLMSLPGPSKDWCSLWRSLKPFRVLLLPVKPWYTIWRLYSYVMSWRAVVKTTYKKWTWMRDDLMSQVKLKGQLLRHVLCPTG